MAAKAAVVNGAAAPRERTLWIHAGMHKTGTKVLQSALRRFDDVPANEFCFPRSSRSIAGFPAHFSVVRDLLGVTWRRELGGLDAALAEIVASGCRTACLSAEAFHTLSERPAALERLRDAARSAGFVPRVVLYLRSQADYLESLYPQLLVLGYRRTFSAFMQGALDGGRVRFVTDHGGSMWFPIEYGRVLDAFRAVFGADGVVARAYDPDAPRDRLVREFFGVIGVDVPNGHDLHAALNMRRSTGGVLRMMRRNLDGDAGTADDVLRRSPRDALADAAPFRPLGLADLVRIARRFGADDARIARTYGAAVVPVTARRWRQAAAAAIGIDRSARAVRRVLRAADEAYGDGQGDF